MWGRVRVVLVKDGASAASSSGARLCGHRQRAADVQQATRRNVNPRPLVSVICMCTPTSSSDFAGGRQVVANPTKQGDKKSFFRLGIGWVCVVCEFICRVRSELSMVYAATEKSVRASLSSTQVAAATRQATAHARPGRSPAQRRKQDGCAPARKCVMFEKERHNLLCLECGSGDREVSSSTPRAVLTCRHTPSRASRSEVRASGDEHTDRERRNTRQIEIGLRSRVRGSRLFCLARTTRMTRVTRLTKINYCRRACPSRCKR